MGIGSKIVVINLRIGFVSHYLSTCQLVRGQVRRATKGKESAAHGAGHVLTVLTSTTVFLASHLNQEEEEETSTTLTANSICEIIPKANDSQFLYWKKRTES